MSILFDDNKTNERKIEQKCYREREEEKEAETEK